MKSSGTSCLSRLSWPAFVVACLTLSAVDAFGEPGPSLTNPPPVYLKQGDSREIELAGSHFSRVASVGVPDPRGLEAVLVKTDKPSDAAAKVKLSASADAPLGVRELRLLAPTGVTAPMMVTIGQYPLVEDHEPNNSIEHAQSVQLPASLLGKIEPAGDVDCFRFDAKAGQHLLFDVHAARLGSSLEPVVAIHDPSGRELPHAVEHHDGDSLLVFDVPVDGSYVLDVRDLQYRGGADFTYRIDAGQIPYVESLVPGSGRRGSKVEVTAAGHNLQGSEKITLDLSTTSAGAMPVRLKTPLGYSNEVSFPVSEMTQATARKPNTSAETASSVNLPAEISGILDKPGDEEWFKFHVADKQTVTLEVIARREGSPLDALLTLKKAGGEVIETNNGPAAGISAVGNINPPGALTPVAADSEAKIIKDLEAGDYLVSIRDLTWAGGPGYAYRLEVTPQGGIPPDFAVRFLPDTPRLHRGGNEKFWCEVVRTGGYKGDISVALEGLPDGVTAEKVLLGESSSGVFTVAASDGAALGVAPIKLKATGVLGSQQAVRYAQPELNGRPVQQAYLTVLEPAPFTLGAVALLKPEQVQQYAGEVAALQRQIETQTPQLDAAQAEWEKHLGDLSAWAPLEIDSAKSAGGATLTKQPDASILASGASPDKDTFTIVAHTDRKGILAVRLEALPDPASPSSGPGRAENGNFVLNRFAVSSVATADAADASRFKPVPLKDPHATFSQDGYDIAGAIDDNPTTGWAISPQFGKRQVATFLTQSPVGGDGGTTFSIVLEHQYGQQHALGRFRISVSADVAAVTKDSVALPASVTEIVKVAADKRTPEQKNELSAYYRSVAPELSSQRQKLESLRSSVGPYAEAARLETILNTGGSALDAAQLRWEQAQAAGAGWTPLVFSAMKSAGGAIFTTESDASVFVGGSSPLTDTYTLTADKPFRNITAIRVEVLPDERLPASGPGRSPSGNFVLSRLAVSETSKSGVGKSPATAPPAQPIELHSPRATFEQVGWPAVGALDDRNDTGWGIGPNVGRPQSAIFLTRAPIAAGDAGTTLTFTLEQLSGSPQHTIGRFRIWITSDPDPDAAKVLPEEIRAILRVAATARNDEQKAALAAYYRSIDSDLDPVRGRLAEIKTRVTPLPMTIVRNRSGSIPVPVTRVGNFEGEVAVTLEGFSAGRDSATRTPASTAKNFTLTPLSVGSGSSFGKLGYRVNSNSETGTRMVVLKGEAKVGDETFVQYSPAFPLTVNEK